MPTETTPVPPSTRSEDPAVKLQRLIAEQGVADTATAERLFGAGKDLWADDAEFDEFLKLLHTSRERG